MATKLLNNIFCNGRKLTNVRYFARNIRKDPFKKTLDVLAIDMPSFSNKKKDFVYPEHSDIVIIGGSHIGSAIAHALKARTGEGLSVVVIEKDFTFKKAQNNVVLGTLSQHFSLPENVHLSKYSIDFLRGVRETLNEDCDLQYTPTGSLVLAGEKYADKLEENIVMLNELGVRNQVLTKTEINRRFPWINTQDIKLGCMAIEGEGTFNSWSLLKALVQKSKELGTTYVNAEVVGFDVEKQKDVLMEGVTPGTFRRINKVIYRTEDNEEYALKFAVCVLAAGSNSGHLAKLAGIGTGKDILQIPLPVEKREYNVYSVEGKASETGLCTPMVMDTTGLWLMRNGMENNLLCGNLPLMKDDTKNMSEQEYLEKLIKPSLINRFPSCENAEINKFTKESHDCNTYDNSGILGPHPYHNNLFLATGFGRLGCQHAPGIGKAITELIIDSQYMTIDLTRFGFDRFLMNEALVEFNVY
ncbi:FAD-dependent oxidoreductase domain containing lethal (2) 37Bb [Anticarsia gemmatalis]|uniref:FAD-dependent oxidoreductase domain containing lethal (2) 37Bb n=1 Tax=Anticarsia gemmatalis TaxID=129554 RepID=UPI003F763302